ncbi:MAG: hypothetical protein M1816_006242 [Peltula sp. TS41687]|nr:MAG: hypothetical protein M1816_006242 [Peltula sp. TS41687]
MSQQVGFNFQGDVFAGGSLAFSAAGRILKALSDKGVDIYAVAAVVELGKRVPITQHQESIVSKSMQKRNNSRRGVLAKALSIGWGHHDVAYELSRTRAGCTALLLMDAFAAGTTPFIAAEALQVLMTLNGCEVGCLPTVDVIKGLVFQVIPILEDSGFHAVLETVRAAATVELGKIFGNKGLEFQQMRYALTTETERPRDWVDAVHQLILTSTRGESIQLHTCRRAAWLAAFAVHTLDLGCTILYQSHVLWAAAGDRGSVIMQISLDAPESAVGFSGVFTLGPGPDPDIHPENLERIYFLRDALKTELLELAGLPSGIYPKINHAIVQLLCSCVTNIMISDYRGAITGSSGDARQAIFSVCRSLGIEIECLEHEISQCIQSGPSQGGAGDPLFNEDVLLAIQRVCLCPEHSEVYRMRGLECLLAEVTNLAYGVVAAALALIPCHYDSSSIRVYARLINGMRETALTSAISAISSGKGPLAVSRNDILGHICSLLHGEEAVPEFCVAVSLGGKTVAFKALLEEEAFGSEGQYLAIYPGRISFNGYFRQFVVSKREYGTPVSRWPEAWCIAAETHFRPYDARHMRSLKMESDIRVLEHSFQIHCSVYREMEEPSGHLKTATKSSESLGTFSIRDALICLLETRIGQRCAHPKDRPFLVPSSHARAASNVCAGVFCAYPAQSSYAFISAHGSRLWQLASLYFLQMAAEEIRKKAFTARRTCLFLQGDLCLSCAYAFARDQCQRFPRLYDRAAIICA